MGPIVEALLREIGDTGKAEGGRSAYEDVPENLRRFFGSKAAMRRSESGCCCASAEQETRCAPDERNWCYNPDEPATCGCP